MAIKEEEMANGKRARGDANAARARADPAPAATRRAGAWFDSQADMLHEVDAVTQAWVQRRREMIEALQQSIAEMRNSHELADMLRIQQAWFIGSLRRVASDLEAWAGLAGTMWQRTVLRFTEAGRSTAEDVGRAGDSIASGSREAQVLSTAGSKPRGRRAAGSGGRR
jgi:hypothetical protein